jgi:hypothetical protein
MPQVRFEPTIPVFEWAKTVHASDRAATVIGTGLKNKEIIKEQKPYIIEWSNDMQILPQN